MWRIYILAELGRRGHTVLSRTAGLKSELLFPRWAEEGIVAGNKSSPPSLTGTFKYNTPDVGRTARNKRHNQCLYTKSDQLSETDGMNQSFCVV